MSRCGPTSRSSSSESTELISLTPLASQLSSECNQHREVIMARVVSHTFVSSTNPRVDGDTLDRLYSACERMEYGVKVSVATVAHDARGRAVTAPAWRQDIGRHMARPVCGFTVKSRQGKTYKYLMESTPDGVAITANFGWLRRNNLIGDLRYAGILRRLVKLF